MAKKNPPPKTVEEVMGATLPFRVVIYRRPTNPSLVGKAGTAVAETEDSQLRIEMDVEPGSRWARTICALPDEVRLQR